MSKILVFAESHQGEVKNVTYEILGRLQGKESHVVCLENPSDDSLGKLAQYGAASITVLKSESLEKYSPEAYASALKEHISKKLICTNPDLTVHRGDIEELCAGSIAQLFESLGGKVIYFGKPHKEIYLSCLEKNQKTLIIGDNLKTDIKGANNMKLDSLFITSGVHRSKIDNV